MKIFTEFRWKLYLELHRVQYLDHFYLVSFWLIFFFFINNIDIAKYADDNTSYIVADNINDLVKSLEEASTALFQLYENLLKSNPDKCHLLISSNENVNAHTGEYEIENRSLRN